MDEQPSPPAEVRVELFIHGRIVGHPDVTRLSSLRKREDSLKSIYFNRSP